MQSTTPSRYPSRGTTDKEALYEILDQGLFCTVAFVRDGVAHQIPTGFARVDNDIYIHASSKSKFIENIIGIRVSFSVTHMDALVLAPTAFDHSFNYRSVIGFAEVVEISEISEKRKFFNLFTDRYIPGRIADVGEPTDEHISITRIAKLSLDNAGAKVRADDVNMKLNPDDPWCGVIPIHQAYGTPEVDTQLNKNKETPTYIKELVNGSSQS